MSNIAKQKKKAAEFELKRQFDKALAIYIELLDGFDKHSDELDVALFNRVGDLLLRQGNVADAVDYYEKAVDRYAEGGFFNNAIALCNKILRQSPGRTSVYYKLGKISAQKGFKNDAKQNFLEYADRMQKSGRMDEAFRALKEFADLCPDQDDIRLMLADQLSKQERGEEAIEQLQTLFDRYSSEGRSVEATATLDRIKAIDPGYQPRATGPQTKQVASELVFLDVYSPSPSTPRGESSVPQAPIDLPVERAPDEILLDSSSDGADIGMIGGLETTSHPTPLSAGDSTLLDFEPTSFGSVPSAAPTPRESTPSGTLSGGMLEGLETMSLDLPSPPSSRTSSGTESVGNVDGFDYLVPADDAESDTSAGPALEFYLPDDDDDAAQSRRPSGELLAEMDPPFLQAATQVDADLSGLEVLATGDEIQPGTDASVREISDGEAAAALNGLPLMDLTTEAASLAEPLDEPAVVPPARPPLERGRHSTELAARTVDVLEASALADPDDFGLRRDLGEARIESGDRDGGLADLDASMIGYERSEDLASAASVADEIARVAPDSVRIHQKRVEYAFRTNERPRLVAAYLDLAAALLGDGQTDKARSVYQRVLDLAPDHVAAQAGIVALVAIADAPARAPRDGVAEIGLAGVGSVTGDMPRVTAPVAPATPPAPGGADFINLGDWLRGDEGPKNTRMVVDEHEPSGDEEADFADMLRKFKQGVAENVDAEDHQSHYDLGVAFKEMGLVDEAISEFQKALRAPANRLPTYEALGHCFVEKGQHQVAKAILMRALSEPNISDEQLIGVLYLLGTASEQLAQHKDALDYYQRVFVVDIRFRDVADRMTAVEQAMR